MPDLQPATLYASRQSRLSDLLSKLNLDALALNPGPSLIYLTGLHFHISERPVTVFFTSSQPPVIVLPELETLKLKGLAFPIHPFAYSEDPAGWNEVFLQAVQAAGLQEALIGVEPTRFRYLELRLLETAAPRSSLTSAEEVLAELRLAKDEGEIYAMRRAVEIAQRALFATLPIITVGLTERQIAAELTVQLLRLGSEGEFPFTPIVSGGPNSANPHATPSNRPLQRGDLLVIDWGAAYQGYVADLTRTFAIGPVEDEFRNIAGVVERANEAGRAACRPGIPASEVDRAARHVIDEADYGQYFTHRTGHGLGLEGHEPPYLRAGNPQILRPGMTFTVEPGIYLPGRGGVRIEDNMVITEDGAESLSDLPRGLQELPLRP